MPRERKGYTFKDKKTGYWYARVTFTDSFGKRRNVKRRAESQRRANDILKQLIREYEDHGQEVILNANKTFEELANFYQDNYLVDAQYINGRKIAGLRSAYDQKLYMKSLIAYFGSKKLRSITHLDLEKYKHGRLTTKTKFDKDRSIAAVNRELALLRRTFNIAKRENWIIKNPFDSSDKLISIADEKKRERIVTKEEEDLLLSLCVELRAHLKPIIICALDTGMRAGEIFSLKWQDIDLAKRLINIQAFNTKTMRSRQVAITGRLAIELEILARIKHKADDLIFGIVAGVKRAFNTLRTKANLQDLRFHDLRHTAATRLVAMGIPLQEVGRILGHTQANTTYRYVNADADTAKRAAEALEMFQKK